MNTRPFGELSIDEHGLPHFQCHTTDTDFEATKVAIGLWIALLQNQLANEKLCPYYVNPPPAT